MFPAFRPLRTEEQKYFLELEKKKFLTVKEYFKLKKWREKNKFIPGQKLLSSGTVS
jgi:hypothetical protein